MQLSLKRRVGTSFLIANVVVMVMGFTVFFFLDSLNNQISNITVSSNKISLLTDEVRISAVSILKMQKKILTTKPSAEDLKRLIASYSAALSTIHTKGHPGSPEGMEANWVQTDPKGRFEVLFRLYAPTEAVFDKS